METVIIKNQTEKILELIDSLERLTWYKNLDEQDYQLIRKILTSCKYQISKSDDNDPISEDIKNNIKELEAVFFELSKGVLVS